MSKLVNLSCLPNQRREKEFGLFNLNMYVDIWSDELDNTFLIFYFCFSHVQGLGTCDSSQRFRQSTCRHWRYLQVS